MVPSHRSCRSCGRVLKTCPPINPYEVVPCYHLVKVSDTIHMCIYISTNNKNKRDVLGTGITKIFSDSLVITTAIFVPYSILYTHTSQLPCLHFDWSLFFLIYFICKLFTTNSHSLSPILAEKFV